MCFSILVSCWESCTINPRKLYDIGMQYKDLYERHPLYLLEKRRESVSKEEYIIYNTYFNNVKYYLEAAAKKGYTKAEYEFARWSFKYYSGRYNAQEYMDNAARKGNNEAKLWLLSQKSPDIKLLPIDFALGEHTTLVASRRKNRCF